MSVIPEELVVRDDRGPVDSEPVRRPSSELDIEASVVHALIRIRSRGKFLLVLVCMITESLAGIGGLYDNVP